MLSLYQFPVNYRSRAVEGNINKVTATVIIFQTWNLYSYLKE
jgi:hypothetical protein